MKNILVLKHYNLYHESGWNVKREDGDITDEINWLQRIERIERYNEMKRMCLASAEKFLLGLDDIVIHDTDVYDIQAGFKQHFFDLYDLWKQGDVNILYADLDVLFIRPFNWFDFSDHFVMYDLNNSGIRYHGHDMTPDTWELAFKRCQTWNPEQWDYEQEIYKEMARLPSNFEHRKIEYNDLVINLPKDNNSAELYQANEKCCAVHFHGSHGDIQINRMKKMFEFLKLN